MVPLISNFTSSKQFMTWGANHEGQGQSAPKTNQISGRTYATFTVSLEVIQTELLKI
jgi:hypothetical protein